jgi:hypothetical protein
MYNSICSPYTVAQATLLGSRPYSTCLANRSMFVARKRMFACGSAVQSLHSMKKAKSLTSSSLTLTTQTRTPGPPPVPSSLPSVLSLLFPRPSLAPARHCLHGFHRPLYRAVLFPTETHSHTTLLPFSRIVISTPLRGVTILD